jgi:hypothetical protein
MGCSDKITTVLAHCKYEETNLKCKTIGTLVVYTWRKAPSFRERGRQPLVYTRASRPFLPHRGTPKIFCSCLVELPNKKYLKCKNVGTLLYMWRKATSFRKRARQPLVYTRASRPFLPHRGTPKIFCSCFVELPNMKMFGGQKTKGQLVAPEISNRIADC